MIKEDCFAYDTKNKECRALEKLHCENNKNCNFYQEREEFLERAKKLDINVKLQK